MISPNYTVGKILIAVSIPIMAEIAVFALDQTTINSLALLGVTIIGLYTAKKTAAIPELKKEVSSVKKTGEAVHTLSNSAMGAQLKLNTQYAQAIAVLAHRFADRDKEPGDVAAAVAADLVVKEQELLLQTHLIQQAKVDADLAREKQQ